MSVWFLLWLFLSLTLLYFFGWTLFVLWRQKKAWRLFAQKRKLRFTPGNLGEAPEMDGVIGDYPFAFFPAQFELGDVRHSRKMTAIEIVLKTMPPFEGFIASGLLVEAVKTSELQHEIKPDHKDWDDQNIALTNHIAAMKAYLTPERQAIVTKWMNTKNIWFIIGFRNGTHLLRVDTPLPLDDPKKVNALVKRLLADIPALEVLDEEKAKLQALIASGQALESPAETDAGAKADDANPDNNQD